MCLRSRKKVTQKMVKVRRTARVCEKESCQKITQSVSPSFPN